MIALDHILPTPLKEMPNGISPSSGIFNTVRVFEKGKNYLVQAPSGKGKSTFFHIVYGLRQDFEGQASLHGRDVRGFSKTEWAKVRQTQLSLVFQDLRLFPQLSALENILLKANQTRTVDEATVRQWADRLGIAAQLGQSAATLSYGQRQRTAIIRALCQPFDCLLLDEPFSHLDEPNTRNASALIEEVCQSQGAGLILVSLGEKYFFRYEAALTL